ncbi:MAG TPA: hypothetical protein VFD62_08810 [Pyrinomonadaceae bacterium]|nr:hypothetical protein [Pyrinomonadaceae bacterium]
MKRAPWESDCFVQTVKALKKFTGSVECLLKEFSAKVNEKPAAKRLSKAGWLRTVTERSQVLTVSLCDVCCWCYRVGGVTTAIHQELNGTWVAKIDSGAFPLLGGKKRDEEDLLIDITLACGARRRL